MDTVAVPGGTRKRLRIIGRLIALLWAGFWTWFGIASGIGEGLNAAGIFMHTLLPGLLFVFFAVMVFKWQWGGAILLTSIGLAVGILYPLFATNMPLMTVIFVEATMALPPLAAGILLLLGLRRVRPLTPAPLPPDLPPSRL